MSHPKFFVLGGAGFIGSHLVESLVTRGPVTVFDNLSVGRREFIAEPLASGGARLIVDDASDLSRLEAALAGHDVVFHLAANPEARWGLSNTRLDLEQGTIVTYNVLEAMRRTGVERLVLASSGTVYGDTPAPCREQDLGPLPISLYGASKLASEALVSAFVSCFALKAWIFRFGNVVGPRGTHGAALDFLNKLKADPEELEVLGDGRQSKPYVHVSDCVAGMLFGLDHAREALNLFNLAPRDFTTVERIARLCILASPYPNATIRFTGGERGWPGDVPTSRLDPGKFESLGFRTRYSSDQAVESAILALSREVFGGA
ncbi:MAG TPA: NAD-dependent epimerase/dehydratase family protein [Polyangiaceae bacterium]|jgi:UDP-glucose 4-epimerase|nr:NAD-dependent epimerase/dehydratase family protein [Polyangiaceae bacterium]